MLTVYFVIDCKKGVKTNIRYSFVDSAYNSLGLHNNEVRKSIMRDNCFVNVILVVLPPKHNSETRGSSLQNYIDNI